MERILAYFWSVRKQFTKYFIVGVSGFVLDLGSLILFKRYFGLSPTVAVICNQPIVLVYNFALNKWWSFQSKILPHKQLVKYLLVALLNYFFSVGAMHFLNGLAGLDYRLARIITVGTMVPINFFLYKYWVYKEVA
jgi:putative flippase GtrA